VKKLLEYIRGIHGIAIASFLSLFVMIFHSAWVYEALTHYTDWKWLSLLQAGAFAIAVDMAVLIFVLRGRKRLSMVFSILQIGMNLMYYYSHVESGFEWFTAMFISVVLPLAIAAFSHEIATDRLDSEEEKRDSQLDTLTETQKTTYDLYCQQSEILHSLTEKVKEFESVIQDRVEPLYDDLVTLTALIEGLETKEESEKIKSALNQTIQTLINIKASKDVEEMKKSILLNSYHLLK
jgi:hypothetical protein